MSDADEEAVRDLILSQYEMGILERHPGVAPRDQHAESIGGLIMGQIVISDLPMRLRRGTFAHPLGMESRSPIRIRYSTSSPLPRPDRARDAIGMAIKIFLPGNREHDLVLADYPVFFCRDAADLYELVERSPSVTRPALSFFVPLARPWTRWRLRELWNMLRAARLKRRVTNPFQETYYSQTTYALGADVVRYVVRPTVRRRRHVPSRLSAGFREREMINQLRSRPISLDLLVQVRTADLPEDDPTRRWSDSLAPPQRIATIEVPRQDFMTIEMYQAAEAISFNPTNTPPEHRALGSINRARALAYEAISRRRRELNEWP